MAVFRLLYLMALSFVLDPCRCQTNCSSYSGDIYTLCDLFKDVSNLPSFWLSDATDVCNWDSTAIQCDASEITSLNLEGYNLSGSITNGVGWPYQMRSILLRDNKLSGTFDLRADVIGNATRKIEIESNEFESLILTNASDASSPRQTNLEILKLSSNNFGKWRKWEDFRSFSSLQQLSFRQCNMTLALDWNVFPTSLTVLYLTSNNLYGTFDTSAYRSRLSLQELYLSNNNFNGTIDWLRFPRDLQHAALDYNDFTGSVEWDAFNNSVDTETLAINNNKFTSSIDLSNIGDKLKYIYANDNSFSGTLSFRRLPTTLVETDFSGNTGIVGPVDFTYLNDSFTINLDVSVFCDLEIYCANMSSCAANPQPRTSDTCTGRSACEATCGTCKTCAPTQMPTIQPTDRPTKRPTKNPTDQPTISPTIQPSDRPTTAEPTQSPTTPDPTRNPTLRPTTAAPTETPSNEPSNEPSSHPSDIPSVSPSSAPSADPSSAPSTFPSATPSTSPSYAPTSSPTTPSPTTPNPSQSPTFTTSPTLMPTTSFPSLTPTLRPTLRPSTRPTTSPTLDPSARPTSTPSLQPSEIPSITPTFPSSSPSSAPSIVPSIMPSASPSSSPSSAPSIVPSSAPTSSPIYTPLTPTTASPSSLPTTPTQSPTPRPTFFPTREPTPFPTRAPTPYPTDYPSRAPTFRPSPSPTRAPTPFPTRAPTPYPTDDPSRAPTFRPSYSPTRAPTPFPSRAPTFRPSASPTTPNPSQSPTTANPTQGPTPRPTGLPTTSQPSYVPSEIPSYMPSISPSVAPSAAPSQIPSNAPSAIPSAAPSIAPSAAPTNFPSDSPSNMPSFQPSAAPSALPVAAPTSAPSLPPTAAPSFESTFEGFERIVTFSRGDRTGRINANIVNPGYKTSIIAQIFENTTSDARFELIAYNEELEELGELGLDISVRWEISDSDANVVVLDTDALDSISSGTQDWASWGYTKEIDYDAQTWTLTPKLTLHPYVTTSDTATDVCDRFDEILFESGKLYTVTLSVNITGKAISTDAIVSVANFERKTNLLANTRPGAGICSVYPSVGGVAWRDEFVVTCSNSNSNETEMVHNWIYDSSLFMSNSFTSRRSLSAGLLPSGTHTIAHVVKDEYNLCSCSYFNVTVSESPRERSSNARNVTDWLESVFDAQLDSFSNRSNATGSSAETALLAVEMIDTLDNYLTQQNLSSDIEGVIDSGAVRLQKKLVQAVLDSAASDLDDLDASEASFQAKTLAATTKSLFNTDNIENITQLQQLQRIQSTGSDGYSKEFVLDVLDRMKLISDVMKNESDSEEIGLDAETAQNCIDAPLQLLQVRELTNESEIEGIERGRKTLQVIENVVQARLVGANDGEMFDMTNDETGCVASGFRVSSDFSDVSTQNSNGSESEFVRVRGVWITKNVVVRRGRGKSVDISSLRVGRRRSLFDRKARFDGTKASSDARGLKLRSRANGSARRRRLQEEAAGCDAIVVGMNVSSESVTFGEEGLYPLCTFFDESVNAMLSDETRCHVYDVYADGSYVECACFDTNLTYFDLSVQTWSMQVSYDEIRERFDAENVKMSNRDASVGIVFVFVWIAVCLIGMLLITKMKMGTFDQQLFDDVPLFVAVKQIKSQQSKDSMLPPTFWNEYRVIREGYVLQTASMSACARVVKLWFMSVKNDSLWFGICLRLKGTNLDDAYRGMLLFAKVLVSSTVMALFYAFNYEKTSFGDWSIVFLESFLASILFVAIMHVLVHSDVKKCFGDDIGRARVRAKSDAEANKQGVEMAVQADAAVKVPEDEILQRMEQQVEKAQYKYDRFYGNCLQFFLVLLIITTLVLSIIYPCHFYSKPVLSNNFDVTSECTESVDISHKMTLNYDATETAINEELDRQYEPPADDSFGDMSKGARFILAIFWANFMFALLWQPLWLFAIAAYKVWLHENNKSATDTVSELYGKQGFTGAAGMGPGGAHGVGNESTTQKSVSMARPPSSKSSGGKSSGTNTASAISATIVTDDGKNDVLDDIDENADELV